MLHALAPLLVFGLLSPVCLAQGTQPASRPAGSQPASQPATQPATQPKAHFQGLADVIEKAHNAKAWQAKTAVRAHITVTFGGNVRIDGPMTYNHHTGETRMEHSDGTVMIFDGKKAYVSPADSPMARARFHLLTWNYFLAAPFKLNDPGTHREPLGKTPMTPDITTESFKLTFGENVGDTPDDWYICYKDLKTDRLAAMSYIVTYGKAADEAEKSPHAIVYGGYKQVDGIWLSTEWTFHKWSEKKGSHGDPIGHVKVADIEFLTPDAKTFAAPEDSRVDELPE